MAKRKLLAAIGGVLALSMIAAACSSGDNSANDGGTAGVTGSVTVSGSSTVQPITNLVAEKFAAENPGVEPSVDGPGTSDGFQLFCNGETDVQDASRQIEAEEVAACKTNGIDYIELEIGLDGLSVVGNPSNPVTCLAFGDLYALFGPESSDFTNWTDADALAKKLGGYDSFPDEELTIVAPGEESGTYGSFIDLAIKSIAEEQKQPDDQLRKGYQSASDDNVIIDNAAGTPGGLGFVGFAYAINAGDTVKLFEVDGGDGCVAPSPETVIDGTYPLSRSLYIYVSKKAMTDNPAVKPFVDLYLSDEGLASVEEAQYVSLPEDRIAASKSAWESASA